MKRKIWLVVAMLAIAGIASFLGIKVWRRSVIDRQERQAHEQAGRLLAEYKPLEAYALIYPHLGNGSKLDWSELELRALVQFRNLPKLALIYEKTPARILGNEEASILVCRAFVQTKRKAECAKLRSLWRGKETRKSSWLAFDADALVAEGKVAEAETFLRSQSLPGTNDATRLVRLSLMMATRNPKESWDLLARASELTPMNPEIRSFQAQVLETVGRMREAEVDYLAALALDPRNPLMRDQLAEFYQRRGSYDMALRVWKDALPDPSLDFIWVKCLFWGKMVQPVDFDWKKSEPPAGDLRALASWMIQLRPDQFSDSKSLMALPQARTYLQDRQELFWLRLLDDLQNHREREAYESLKFNQFRARSWHADLEAALLRILYYRQKNLLNSPDLVFHASAMGTNQHSFYLLIENLARTERSQKQPPPLPAETDVFLRGPNAFAGAFLAAGWREAAIRLHSDAVSNTPTPEWYAFGMTQILRVSRDNAQAVKYLRNQKSSPALELLNAEIQIDNGDKAEGLKQLAVLAPQDSQVGFRAAYLLALACMEENKPDIARKWVNNNARLFKDDLGQELLARVAAIQGNTNEMERIYHSIEKTSVEARTILARVAFSRKQWNEARRYTLELTQIMPEQAELRENLKAIDKAESGK
jgi:predicted Zn-dependent protease